LFLLSVANEYAIRGANDAMRDRPHAMEFLADRMFGKAPQAVGIAAAHLVANVNEPSAQADALPDLSMLSDAELNDLERITAKMLAPRALPDAQTVLLDPKR
jgi:hypothetical protein